MTTTGASPTVPKPPQPPPSRTVPQQLSASWAAGDVGFEQRYRAIAARDTRFDGQFFTAVASTGIYCRPSCPARTPKPEHVTFFLTSAAAHEAGFRACKRCLPEATPGTPAWDLRRDLAGRAMRLIADGVIDREGVGGLAARLGYTERHVHRVLVKELGAGPLALARARRAQSARALLVGSGLPMAEVAFAAGFGSVRQFNDTVAQVFATAPRDLRDGARGAAGRGAANGAPVDGDGEDCSEDAGHDGEDGGGAGDRAAIRLDIDLPVRQPFDAPGVFAFLAARAIPGVETADLGPARLRYARTLTLPSGPAAVEVISEHTGRWTLRGRLELTALADVGPAVARVRRLLDLDADPEAVDAALSDDPALAALVARTPGIRVPRTTDPHELVVRAMVGQQISVAAARTHLTRLAQRLGSPYASTIAGLDRVFPTPAQIAAMPEPEPDEPLDPERALRLPRRGTAAVVEVARSLAAGDLDVHVGVDREELRRALQSHRGIGPWTAAYVAMRVLGDPDAWLVNDVALLAGARAVAALPDAAYPRRSADAHARLAARAAAWAPWRSYAAMHLWQATSPTSGGHS